MRNSTTIVFPKRRETERERGKRSSPAVRDGDDSGAILSDLEEHRHGEIEVRPGRIAPTTIIRRKGVIRRAEIGSSDENRGIPTTAPPRIIDALDLKTSATAKPLVEQRRAQRRRLHAVPLAIKVPISTRSS